MALSSGTREDDMSSRWVVLMAILVAATAACTREDTGAALALPGRDFGIEISGVRLLSSGDLAQLDYRVVDYEKAKSLLKGEMRLLPEGGEHSIQVTSIGRLGPMRQRPSATGRRQFMLFTNSGRLLKKGDTAVLVLDVGRIPGIPVS
jgi:hypothetical protein